MPRPFSTSSCAPAGGAHGGRSKHEQFSLVCRFTASLSGTTGARCRRRRSREGDLDGCIDIRRAFRFRVRFARMSDGGVEPDSSWKQGFRASACAPAVTPWVGDIGIHKSETVTIRRRTAYDQGRDATRGDDWFAIPDLASQDVNHDAAQENSPSTPSRLDAWSPAWNGDCRIFGSIRSLATIYRHNIQGDFVALRYFAYNISLLFYNWYKLEQLRR